MAADWAVKIAGPVRSFHRTAVLSLTMLRKLFLRVVPLVTAQPIKNDSALLRVTPP